MRQATIKTQTVRAVNQKVSLTQAARGISTVPTRKMSAKAQSNEDFDSHYINYFDRQYPSFGVGNVSSCLDFRSDIDGWQIRKGMGDLAAMDLVPDPQIVAAALRACRRINDFSLTTRILEVIRIKCGDKEPEIWPYMLQELGPTLSELGIPTPAKLGYDQPELALPNPYEIH